MIKKLVFCFIFAPWGNGYFIFRVIVCIRIKFNCKWKNPPNNNGLNRTQVYFSYKGVGGWSRLGGVWAQAPGDFWVRCVRPWPHGSKPGICISGSRMMERVSTAQKCFIQVARTWSPRHMQLQKRLENVPTKSHSAEEEKEKKYWGRTNFLLDICNNLGEVLQNILNIYMRHTNREKLKQIKQEKTKCQKRWWDKKKKTEKQNKDIEHHCVREMEIKRNHFSPVKRDENSPCWSGCRETHALLMLWMITIFLKRNSE